MSKLYAWFIVFLCCNDIIMAKTDIGSERRTVSPATTTSATAATTTTTAATTTTTTMENATSGANATVGSSNSRDLSEYFRLIYWNLCSHRSSGLFPALYPANLLEQSQRTANINPANLTAPTDLINKPNLIRLLLERVLRLEDGLIYTIRSPPAVAEHLEAIVHQLSGTVQMHLRETSGVLRGLLRGSNAQELEQLEARLLRVYQVPLPTTTGGRYYRMLLVLSEALLFHRELLRYTQQIVELGVLEHDPRLPALEQSVIQAFADRTR